MRRRVFLAAMVGVLACGGPADDLGSSGGTSTSGSGSATTGTTSSDASSAANVDGSSTTAPAPTGPPRILDLGKNLTAMTEDDTVVFTAAVDDPDGDDDVAWGELRRSDDDDAIVAAFVPAESGRWVASVSWTDLVGDLSFAGPTAVEVVATFADLDDQRAEASTTLTVFCAGLAGGACAGTCVDFDSDAVHCGGCDQPCASTCQAGTCPPG